MFRWNFVIYPAVGRTIKFSPRIRLGELSANNRFFQLVMICVEGQKINMCALLGSGEAIFFLNVDSNVEENEKVGGIMEGSLVN